MPVIAPIRIPTNALLKGPEPAMSLDEALLMKGLVGPVAALAEGVANIASVSEDQLLRINAEYGPPGLFRLNFLAMGHKESEFQHFFKLIQNDLTLLPLLTARDPVELQCDNDRLPQSDRLTEFNSTVLMPSLARKLYNPGRHPGYLVYGLGGPKILVSHPFRGAQGELYDIYGNSIDVATSLMMRGYRGTFLFFDYLPGLNFEMEGVPAWLLWFSLVAGHSDLVVFVKYGGEFGRSQELEAEFTPNRVLKKIVEIPDGELQWAEEHELVEIAFYAAGEEGSTKEDFYRVEAKHAKPFLDGYVQPGVPDALIRIDESGQAVQFPLDFPVYEAQLG